MKNLFAMITGVIVGITGVLLLTLNLWGSEWYKVIVAIAAGVLIGLMVVSPRETWGMIKKSFRRKRLTVNNAITLSNTLGICLSIILIAIYTAILIALILAPFYFFKVEVFGVMGVILTLVALAYSCIIGATSMDIRDWRDRNIKRVWGDDSDNNEISTVIFLSLQKSGITKTALKIFRSTISSFFNHIKRDTIMTVQAITILTLVTGAFFLVSLPLLPIRLLKEIGKHGWSLNVATSIVIGGLVGTLSGLYFVGIGVGIFSVLLLFMAGKFISTFDPFFVYEKGGWVYKTIEKIGG